MPKKKKKSREETTAEGYFPVSKDDLKYTIIKKEKVEIPEELLKHSIEIPVKEGDGRFIRSSVEKKYLKLDRSSLEKVERVEIKKKKRDSKKKIKSESAIREIELKDNGYELIITEKPQAALKIASALGQSTRRDFRGVSYYEVKRDGKKIVVACAVGHLFTLKQNVQGSKLPVFDIKWVPNFIAKKNDFTKKYYDVLLILIKNAGSLTIATDYDVEGEVIGLNVVRFICGQKDANRMKFSTLTDSEINDSYEKKFSTLNWGQAIAGETRHYLDWFYGINLSRALMNAIKTTGRFKIMSIGRVQGPALNLIVKKEREIQAFKSKPYWQIFINVSDGKNKIKLKHDKDIFNKDELKKFSDLNGKNVRLENKKTKQIFPPNPPFNLTTLQTEAYKFHGITPSNTLRVAQSLYLAGLISYPRTSSQKLPASIGYREILKKLAKQYGVEEFIKKEKPVEGKKSDPAHPSIYPTGQGGQGLSGDEKKIYELVVKRFLALFCEDAVINTKMVKAFLDNLSFSAKGFSLDKKAWMEIYPLKMNESEIPDMKEEGKIVSSSIEEKETQPPRRYSQASIISELEKRNLGTKSTRAAILETLYDRGYVKERSVEATPLGISLISSLEKHSPIIIDEQLTRNLEQKMESIAESKKNFEKKEEVINKAKEVITEIISQFEKNEEKIGKELLDANVIQEQQQKLENKLILCPV
ncbi:MAG: DNA topoisomerase I, partial [Nanoarchaeota archaeon]